jgi:hypothetical protein
MHSGRGLCDAPIPPPEESNRVCVLLNVIRWNNNSLHLQLLGSRGPTKKERKEDEKRYSGK